MSDPPLENVFTVLSGLLPKKPGITHPCFSGKMFLRTLYVFLESNFPKLSKNTVSAASTNSNSVYTEKIIAFKYSPRLAA